MLIDQACSLDFALNAGIRVGLADIQMDTFEILKVLREEQNLFTEEEREYARQQEESKHGRR